MRARPLPPPQSVKTQLTDYTDASVCKSHTSRRQSWRCSHPVLGWFDKCNALNYKCMLLSPALARVCHAQPCSCLAA